MNLDENIILPFGVMIFFILIWEGFVHPLIKTPNLFMIGTLFMYVSWLVVYLIYIKPNLKKKK